jgi:hypothetical protein
LGKWWGVVGWVYQRIEGRSKKDNRPRKELIPRMDEKGKKAGLLATRQKCGNPQNSPSRGGVKAAANGSCCFGVVGTIVESRSVKLVLLHEVEFRKAKRMNQASRSDTNPSIAEMRPGMLSMIEVG